LKHRSSFNIFGIAMKHSHHVKIIFHGLLFIIVLSQYGCFIFTPVGNAISSTYDNTVSYFNVYYNASRIFNEAEDEIRTAAITNRVKESASPAATPQIQIQGSTKQKFGQVIDKCSYILAFYSSSSLVDDALMLIGKSFYYQMEYIKSERKFEELIAKYPNSSLVLEAQLWLAQTEEKLGKYEDGIRLAEQTVSDAIKNNEDEIETQTHLLLGVLYNNSNQPDKAIAEYEKGIEIAGDNDIKSEAQISLGKVYFATGKYSKAAETFLKVRELTSDIYLKYYSGLQAAISYGKLEEYKKELSLLNEMIEDFRNKEYLPSLLYERANNYLASGSMDDAIAEYFYIDTTYIRTEHAARSAYKLGTLYTTDDPNYALALKYYTEVNSALPLDITPDGKRKFTAFTKYFDARKKIFEVDSLLMVIQDTTRKIIIDTNLTAATDSVNRHGISNDSTKENTTQSVLKPVNLNADSINIIKSIAAQELGDIFYSEILVPDSAFYWYNKSLSWNYHKVRSPRILYVLAEHSRTNPEKKYPLPAEYHNRLIQDFPESVYADEARRFLGKEIVTNKSDSADIYFAKAEKEIDSQQYNKAIETFRKIRHSFPKSHLSAKSEFAIGWIYENRLSQPDSATAHYKLLVKDYKGTLYAESASKRLFEEQKIDTSKTIGTKADTIKRATVPLIDKKAGVDVEDESGLLAKPKDERGNRRNRVPTPNPNPSPKDIEEVEKR
jgi:tetratricopeptide (TPR) repeat protein